MAKRKIYHVVYSKEEKCWKVKAENATRATSTHKTKKEAVKSAIDLAKRQKPSQVKIHLMDGSFEIEYTYDDDPRDVKG